MTLSLASGQTSVDQPATGPRSVDLPSSVGSQADASQPDVAVHSVPTDDHQGADAHLPTEPAAEADQAVEGEAVVEGLLSSQDEPSAKNRHSVAHH